MLRGRLGSTEVRPPEVQSPAPGHTARNVPCSAWCPHCACCGRHQAVSHLSAGRQAPMPAMVGCALGGPRSQPLLPVSVPLPARPLSPSLSSLPLPPLSALLCTPAHGNEKHIGFIIPGLNEQGCHGDSHLRPARGQGRGWRGRGKWGPGSG